MKKFLLALACVAGFGSIASAADTYKLVTDASTLKAGDQIVIAGHYVTSGSDYDINAWYAIGTKQNSNNRSGAFVTVVDDEITPGDDVQIFTLEENGSNWNLNVGDGKYLGSNDLSNNRCHTVDAPQAVSISDSGIALTASGTNVNLYINCQRKGSSVSTVTCAFYKSQTSVNYCQPKVFKLVEEEAPVADEHYVLFENNGNYTTPCVWAWTKIANCTASGKWPGDAMTLVEGSTYKWVLPAGKDVPDYIIISDNGGTKAGGGDLTYVDGATYNKDGLVTNEPIEYAYTVYYKNTWNWNPVCVHIWNGGDNNGWPGAQMTKVEGEENLYSLSFNASFTPANLLFNQNGDGNQTGNFEFENGATYDYNGKVTSQGGDEETTVAIVGAFCDWKGENAISTTTIVDNCATIVVENFTGSAFKVIYKGVWYGLENVTLSNGQWSAELFDSGENNLLLPASANGKNVTFTFATNTKTVKAEWTEEQSGDDPEDPFGPGATFGFILDNMEYVWVTDEDEYGTEEFPVTAPAIDGVVTLVAPEWDSSHSFYIMLQDEAYNEIGVALFGTGTTLENGVAAVCVEDDAIAALEDGEMLHIMTLPESANGKEVTVVFIPATKTITASWTEEAAPQIDVVAIVGAFNSWNATANATTLIEDNCATIVVENYTNVRDGQGQGFKVLYNGQWLGLNDYTIVNGEWTPALSTETSDIDLAAAEGKDVTFTFALDTYTLKVEWDETVVDTPTYTIDFTAQGWENGDTNLYKTAAGNKVIWRAFINEHEWLEFETVASSKGNNWPSAYPTANKNIGLRVYGATANDNEITVYAPAECKIVNVTLDNASRINGEDVPADATYVFSSPASSFSFKAPEGSTGAYKSMTIGISGTPTGVESIASENAPVEYYNLQGVRVANPNAGIYIMRQGNKVSKVLVK